MHLVIFGCGYSGTAIAKAFLADGFRVSGTTRSQEKAAALRAQGIEAFVFDGETLDPALVDAAIAPPRIWCSRSHRAMPAIRC
jgi:nucleoside-diphosphate-sugar epimerase